MKKCLSQIPECQRKEFIRQEAIHRVYNKLNNQFKEVRRCKNVKTN